MRTFFAAFALLATVNAAGGGAETPKEKEAQVSELNFEAAQTGETIKMEYLQRLVNDKGSLIVAMTLQSKNDAALYNARVNLNIKAKDNAECLSRSVIDIAETGVKGAGTAAQETYTTTLREAKATENAKCDTAVKI